MDIQLLTDTFIELSGSFVASSIDLQLNRVFDKNFCLTPNWLKSYMQTASQSTMMGKSCSASVEGLNHVVPKWSNKSSKLDHLVFSLSQRFVIVAYQIPCSLTINIFTYCFLFIIYS